MGSHHNYTLAFIIIFVALMIPAMIRSDRTTHSLRMNTQYGTKLTAAAHSAILKADPKGLVMAGYIWTRKEDRERALETFFKSLSESYMKDSNNENIRIAVPFILLIDVDGYYLCSNALFDWASIRDLTKINDFNDPVQMNSIMAWGEDRYGYHVRYYLNDYVEVSDPATNKTYKGDRHTVAQELTKDGKTGDIITFLDGTMKITEHGHEVGETYKIHREEFIVAGIEETIRTYINQYNYSAGRNGGGYNLTMPRVPGETWHRMLENPTLLCFMQGKNVFTSKEVINTFAYAGSEIFKTDKYFITAQSGTHTVLRGRENLGTDENKIYHSYRKALAAGELSYNADGELVFAGHGGGSEVINRLYNTMADCASEGALPCKDCIP